ncbi:MAG: DUF3006 domain-containing protein [Firmicutes bacterium]|nr:DUF3006 domain-containing protein [Bacillota bacterium]
MLKEWWRINTKQCAVIDRIVDGMTAVLLLEEGQGQITVPVEKLPVGSGEGIWLLLTIQDGVLIDVELDLEKTEQVKGRIASKRALLLARMARRKQSQD